MSEWRPIGMMTRRQAEETHFRGLWVYDATTKEPLYWDAVCGFVDDDGEFVTLSGDDCGWSADDFTHWMPNPRLPASERRAT